MKCPGPRSPGISHFVGVARHSAFSAGRWGGRARASGAARPAPLGTLRNLNTRMPPVAACSGALQGSDLRKCCRSLLQPRLSTKVEACRRSVDRVVPRAILLERRHRCSRMSRWPPSPSTAITSRKWPRTPLIVASSTRSSLSPWSQLVATALRGPISGALSACRPRRSRSATGVRCDPQRLGRAGAWSLVVPARAFRRPLGRALLVWVARTRAPSTVSRCGRRRGAHPRVVSALTLGRRISGAQGPASAALD